MNLVGGFLDKKHTQHLDSQEGYFLNCKMYVMPQKSVKNKIASISVIIPCYNCEDTILRALRSVEEQTLTPKEVIIINDGSSLPSSNNIIDICNSRKEKAFRTILINLGQNCGPGFARNAGWKISSCEYLAFLDADDAWHPMKLEIQYDWMKRRPDVLMTGHQSIVIPTDTDLSSIKLPKKWEAIQVKASIQLFSNRFHTRSVMIKNESPFRFTTKRGNSEDYELWLEIVLSKFPAWRLELPLSFTYKSQYGSGGLSGRLHQMEKKEIASYFELYRKKLIPALFLITLIPVSLTKYLKRIIIANIRKRLKR
jgi:teichuronic acid biosynthesis glycosyltransferase TuaG